MTHLEVSQTDTIDRNTYRNVPATLAEWTIASHVTHAQQATKTNPPAPTVAGK
jgi:hypothetical protein